MAAAGEIRENPGGRRLLLRAKATERGPRGPLWDTLQLNGSFAGEPFGVPERELDSWALLATLPSERS